MNLAENIGAALGAGMAVLISVLTIFAKLRPLFANALAETVGAEQSKHASLERRVEILEKAFLSQRHEGEGDGQ